MNQISCYLSLLLIAGGMLFSPRLTTAQVGTVTGVVQVSGTVITDAEIRLRELGLRTSVDETGSFKFEGVRPGDYVLEGESPRWGRGTQDVTVVPGVNTSVIVELQTVFHMGELVVTTVPGIVRQDKAYQATTVLTSRDLLKLGESTLGETLSKQPGLSSTYFGPGSSRPIIRGLGGDRVKMLQNGLELGDASGTSPDHAVSVEPRMAEQIEVVRGPATLLYGSSAVGGVVNVIDAAIARDLPSEKISGFLEGLGGTVADERTGSLGLTSRFDNVVVTGSGVLRRSKDFNIPGYATKDADHRDEHEALGVMANSSVESQSGTLGASLVGSKGYFGLSVFDQWSNYGVPGHAPHEEEGHDDHAEDERDEEGVRIDLDRSRINLEGGLRFQDSGFSSGFRNLTLSFAQNDYVHEELEENAVATTFTNKSYEGRVESDHALGERVAGSIGMSFYSRDFTVSGKETFVPATATKNKALFLYENILLADELGLQIGSRIEQRDVKTVAKSLNDRAFEVFSNSMGLSWSPSEKVSFVLSGSRSAKMPNAEELFSNGPHLATGSFEVGDANLKIEKSTSFDGTLNFNSSRFRGTASLYNNDFKNYIYLVKDGNDHDHGLPEYHYSQANAKFQGFEFETEFDLIHGDRSLGTPHLSFGLMGDAVIGKLFDDHEVNYIPRLPPYRIGSSLSFSQGLLSSDVAVRYSGRQGKVASGEEITEAFTMADASVTYRLFSGAVFHDISLVVNNVTNVDARLHQSFQKEIAPLPGREVRLIYRMNF